MKEQSHAVSSELNHASTSTKRGPAAVVGCDGVALISPDRFLEHREQEAFLGSRNGAGKKSVGQDDIGFRKH
jgi:hypothetical protein